MGNRQMNCLNLNAVLFLVISTALLAGGCAKMKPAWEKSTATLKDAFSSSGEGKPGKFACPQVEQHQLSLAASEISPDQVYPDDEITHTVTYALCAPSDKFTMKGTLTRRIIFKNKELFKDSGIETFKAGTQRSIEAEITIPERAPAGVYTLETIIQYDNITLKRSATFRVKRED